MKAQLFALALKEPIEGQTFDFLFRFAGQEKQQRIERLRFKKDRDLMLIGDILAKHCVAKVFKIDFSSIEIAIGEHGKPYVSNYPDVHFNISHSGKLVVCAVLDKPVGIDVQKMRDANFTALAKRAFTQKEHDAFHKVPKEDIRTQFYKTWTAKESYIKLLGTGLKDLKKDIPASVCVKTLLAAPDYMVSVCF